MGEIRNQEPIPQATGVPTFRKERERWGTLRSLWVSEQNNFGMEECAGYAGANCNQVALAGEDFYFTGAGQFGKIYRPAMAYP
jgi:hypothetical protein